MARAVGGRTGPAAVDEPGCRGQTLARWSRGRAPRGRAVGRSGLGTAVGPNVDALGAEHRDGFEELGQALAAGVSSGMQT